MLKDKYLQPDVTDEVWDDSLVLELVREFVPDAQMTVSVDETGGEARTYAVGNSIILKTQRPHRLRLSTSLEKEVFMLRQLQKHSDIGVPRVLGYSKRSNLIECTVMTRVPGDAIVRTEVTDDELALALYLHGQALRKLHSLDVKPFIESGLFPHDGDREGMVERFFHRLNRTLGSMGGVAEIEILRAKQLGEVIISQIPDGLQFVALHSNPYKEHTFVLPDKTYSGMIDFGDSYISHPVNDMRRWSFVERSHLLRGYESLGAVDEKFMQVWTVNYQIDAMLDILRKKSTLADIGDKNDLLKWN